MFTSAATILIPISLFLLLLSLCFILFWSQKKTARFLQVSLKDNEILQRSLLDNFSQQLQLHLSHSSQEALTRSTDSMLKLASHQLSHDRDLIQHGLKNSQDDLHKQFASLREQMEKLAELVSHAEKEKGLHLSKLSMLITSTQSQTAELLEATSSLNSILSSSQSRGQLGERIADDILRLAGFIENINYTKQKTLENGLRPDFTFTLPNGNVLNMDVKFPIQNYTRYLEANERSEKDKFSKAFLSDVRACYKELSDRGYSELPESVDCVLMLIPHEQVFGFIMQQDPSLFDQGLKNKIITCSPMTLFAVLAVMRKAIDHFSIEKTSEQILENIAGLRKQWDLYSSKFQSLGKKIHELQNEYDTLCHTRTRLLDKQFEKIERIQKDVALSPTKDSHD